MTRMKYFLYRWAPSLNRRNIRVLGGLNLFVQNQTQLTFVTKPNVLTLSARSGTTIPNFFVFFADFCMHATPLIIVPLFSNLRCWIVHYLSFLEKKSELSYLHLGCSTTFHVFWSIFFTKTSKKMRAFQHFS